VSHSWYLLSKSEHPDRGARTALLFRLVLESRGSLIQGFTQLVPGLAQTGFQITPRLAALFLQLVKFFFRGLDLRTKRLDFSSGNDIQLVQQIFDLPSQLLELGFEFFRCHEPRIARENVIHCCKPILRTSYA